MSLSFSPITPPLQSILAAAKRPARIGRPTSKAKGGQASWVRRLLAAGRVHDAYAYATTHRLMRLLADVPLPPALVGGGEGGQPDGGDNYNYKSTQEVRILQSGGTLTLGVGAIREVAGAIALAEEVAASGGSGAAQETAQELHSPDGESEGNRGFGQANKSVEKAVYVNAWGESRWVEEGEGLVGKVCRNKQYNELRMEREGGGELWTKVSSWQWRNGFVRGERVWVRRVWVSGDDTDAEYAVVRRMDVNENAVGESEPMVVGGAQEKAVAISVAVVATAEAMDRSHVLPQFLKQDTVFPRKPESAEDYILRIREEAAQWANGAGA